MVPPSRTSRSVRVAPAVADPLLARFLTVRDRTVALCAPLSAEDHVVQPMPDASPAKWHLAHTTWFFEAFVLGGEPFDPAFEFLFNSYYETVGPRVPRPRRGMLTRPGLHRILEYRAAIDQRIAAALGNGALDEPARARLELGLHHEQQHQELILTDAKYLLGTQPLAPAYRALPRGEPAPPVALTWRSEPGGIVEIGAAADGFAFDNERPRHRALVPPYRIASRPVANAEVLAFIAGGGYRDPRLWLSDGWQLVQAERWTAPLYWLERDGELAIYELAGIRAVDPGETACHLSLYEADAIARWLGARLPTEVEWEHAAAHGALGGNFVDTERLHPDRAPAADPGQLAQLLGDVWEWTASSYTAYPGFRALPGALGEYNGKFMSGQYVLRGGSCFTPADHIRASYRNFFPAHARWQMTGVRLASDA
ncbi:MAG TPA: ergothioneine biosynthesis protein EgtB [Kofleriaceae bacterium]|jgi:ergothioneine biosynthesis protein EgtB|nr:ergothioneine biosynthesis protein EgtB [Kofleriaceae bacterium]